MRDHLVFWINGRRHEVRGHDLLLPLSTYLRDVASLTGTKVVCSEGDCGACTVLVGMTAGDRFQYRPVDSCIRFVFQLDGCHVLTIEGLAAAGELSAVQRAMVELHGSQCGFCTPGFVMTMTANCQAHETRPTSDEWPRALAGNLCRCTGYTSIFRAAEQAAGEPIDLHERFDERALIEEAQAISSSSLMARASRADGDECLIYGPTTVSEALEIRRWHPGCCVVAGATDLGVQWNKGRPLPAVLLDLSRVDELTGWRVESIGERRVLQAGGRATWTELLAAAEQHCPEFARVLEVFGAPQIRNVGTIGGNIVNGSPIADSLPIMFALDAEVELRSLAGSRRVPIERLYQGYKQLDLRPDELLTSVTLPLPTTDEHLRLYKVSRRLDLDISTFTAAICVRIEGMRIASAAIAYGGVGPTVARLRQTEAGLVGQRFEVDTFRAAADLAATEIAPISDVRGAADYRRQLARNVLLRFYAEHEEKFVRSQF